MKRRYTVLLERNPDSDIYTVTVPLLPGCITQGDGIADALANAEEAIRAYLKSLSKDGEDVPEEAGAFELASVDVDVEATALTG